MRAKWIALGVLGLALAPVGALRAGVYNVAEGDVWPLPSTFREFQLLLGDLRGAAVEKPGGEDPRSRRSRYLQALAERKARHGPQGHDLLDRVTLSAYLLRLDRAEDAAAVFEERVSGSEPGAFLALANQASAHFRAGRLDRAITSQEEALAAWPEVWPGWTRSQLVFYRRVEQFQLNLLRLRNREALQRAAPMPGAPDELFPGVRWVGESGRFEPGELAVSQAALLPPDAPAIVMQLVLWHPFDDRLYWLFGELCNANGEVLTAYGILDDLGYARRFDPVQAHRRELFRVRKEAEAIQAHLNNPLAKEQLLWAAAPRGAAGPAGVGGWLGELGWAALEGHFRKAQQPESPGPAFPPSKTPPQPPSTDVLPDWRTLTVAFVFGALVCWIMTLQFKRRA